MPLPMFLYFHYKQILFCADKRQIEGQGHEGKERRLKKSEVNLQDSENYNQRTWSKHLLKNERVVSVCVHI